MGRTNLILLVMGVLACVILALIMQRSVKMHKANAGGKIVRAVNDTYGSRLQASPTFKLETRGERKVGVLTLMPQVPTAASRLARDVGRFVWQEEPDKFQALEVLCKRHPKDKGRIYRVPKPYLKR